LPQLLILTAPPPAFATVRIVTSLQDFASIADALGGKRVETFALAKGYQDPHFVEAKPSFILKLSRADLLIRRGARARARIPAAAHRPEPQRKDPPGRFGLPRRLGRHATSSSAPPAS